MNLPYLARLLCLCLASFFLLNLVLGLAVSAFAPSASRLAKRLSPRNAARALFTLRLAPFLISIFVIAVICLPSYLRMEPDAIDEPVGWLCLSASVLGALSWICGLARGVRALVISNCVLHRWQQTAESARIPGDESPVLIIESPEPLFAVAGLFRPRLIVSRRATEAFTKDETASALRHERAHCASHDNLKRLILLTVPGMLPFRRMEAELDRQWAAISEFAADDAASSGDPQRSLSLAAALVRAARIESAPPLFPELVTALRTGQDLSLRVDRLLRFESRQSAPNSSVPRSTRYTIGACTLTILAISTALYPAILSAAHEVLERLVH